MNSLVKFKKKQIAPCGMNCGTCIGFLREKNRCIGCRLKSDAKPKSCSQCIIINCELLDKTTSKFCYDCEKFPCKRLRQLDKRYRTKYNTGFIQNLLMIKETGIENFLTFEVERRTCPVCGSVLSVHRNNCLKCQYDLTNLPKLN